jgi:hypothetical protein
LLLPALWDAAFDRGLISFADDGSVLASPALSNPARKALNIDSARRLPACATRTGRIWRSTGNGMGFDRRRLMARGLRLIRNKARSRGFPAYL